MSPSLGEKKGAAGMPAAGFHRPMFKRLRLILRHPFLFATVSAALLRLAYPTFDVWVCAWFGLVPLLAAVAGQKPRPAFLTGFVAGFVFFGLTLYWVVHVTLAGAVLLSLYCGLYLGLFGLAYSFAAERLGWLGRCVWTAAFWVCLEYLRSHAMTGFPWALLAYTQSGNLWAIQIADTIGAYGVSFLLVFVNAALLEVIEALTAAGLGRRPTVLGRGAVLLAVIGTWLGYGADRLYEDPRLSAPLKVSIIQGNIAQEIKWVPRFSQNIFNKYVLLTQIVGLRDDPDVIIWPETSFPDYLEVGVNDEPLGCLAREIGRPLLVGAIRLQDIDYFNSALLYLPSGRLAGLYDKLHLVPFGEYLPGRRQLPFLANVVPIEDFTRGGRHTVFSLKGERCPLIRASVLICFEDIFPDLARAFVGRGADFLINMTNDAWFKDTASPYQHYQASVFRAVENRVYVVRAANTGISCIIDDAGRRVARAEDAAGKPTFVTETLAGAVYKTGRGAAYTYFGERVMGCILLVNLLGLMRGIRRKKRERA